MGLIGILVALGLLIWLALSGLERASARSSRCDPRGRLGRGAPARPLDANLHGQYCTFHHAVFPDFSSRRAVLSQPKNACGVFS